MSGLGGAAAGAAGLGVVVVVGLTTDRTGGTARGPRSRSPGSTEPGIIGAGRFLAVRGVRAAPRGGQHRLEIAPSTRSCGRSL